MSETRERRCTLHFKIAHARYACLFFVCNHVTRRPCWWSIQKKFFCKICIKIEFISQRRETLLFLTTNMAAVTSLANQQCFPVVFTLKKSGRADELLEFKYIYYSPPYSQHFFTVFYCLYNLLTRSTGSGTFVLSVGPCRKTFFITKVSHVISPHCNLRIVPRSGRIP